MLRELGVLLTSIMIAGRSGSAFTAEIGSMKMREEIDALRVMGLDPDRGAGRCRASSRSIIALPLLTFLADMAALFGGLLVAWVYGGISPEVFMARLQVGDRAQHLPGRAHQGAVHGAGHRHDRLHRGARDAGLGGIARPAGDLLGGEVDLHGDRASTALFAMFFAAIEY